MSDEDGRPNSILRRVYIDKNLAIDNYSDMKKAKTKGSKISWWIIFGIVCSALVFYYYLTQSVSSTSKTEIKITFMRGLWPTAVKRHIPLQASTSIVQTAEYCMKFLLNGPSPIEKMLGIFSEIPESVKVQSIRQDGDILVLDLSSDFIEGRSGASSIQGAITQIVYTLIELRDINRVRFLIDGKDQEIVIGGEGLVIDGPIGKKDLGL